MENMIQENTQSLNYSNNIVQQAKIPENNISLNPKQLDENQLPQPNQNSFLENLRRLREQSKNKIDEIEKQKQQKIEEKTQKEKTVFENYKKQVKQNDIFKEIEEQKSEEIKLIQIRFDEKKQIAENQQNMKRQDSIFNAQVISFPRSRSPILKTKKKFLPPEIKYQLLNAQRKKIENGEINYFRRTKKPKSIYNPEGETLFVYKKPPKQPVEEIKQKNEKKIEQPVEEEKQQKKRQRKQVFSVEQEELEDTKKYEITNQTKKVKTENIFNSPPPNLPPPPVSPVTEKVNSDKIEQTPPTKKSITSSIINKQLQLQQQRKLEIEAEKQRIQNEQKQQQDEKKQNKISEYLRKNKQSKDNTIKQDDVDQMQNEKYNEKDNKNLKQDINKEKYSKDTKQNNQVDQQILQDNKMSDRERSRDFKTKNEKSEIQNDKFNKRDKTDQILKQNLNSIELSGSSIEEIDFFEKDLSTNKKSDKIKDNVKQRLDEYQIRDVNTNRGEKIQRNEKFQREEKGNRDDKIYKEDKRNKDDQQIREEKKYRDEKFNKDEKVKSENNYRNEKKYHDEQSQQKELKSILKKHNERDDENELQPKESFKNKDNKVTKSLEKNRHRIKQENHIVDREEHQNEFEKEENLKQQNAYNLLFSSASTNDKTTSKNQPSNKQQTRKNCKVQDDESFDDDRQINFIEDRAKNIYEKMRANVFDQKASQFYKQEGPNFGNNPRGMRRDIQQSVFDNIIPQQVMNRYTTPIQQIQNMRFQSEQNNPTTRSRERNLDNFYQNSQQYTQLNAPISNTTQGDYKGMKYAKQNDDQYYQKETGSRQQYEHAKASHNGKNQQGKFEESQVFNMLQCVREQDRGFLSQMFEERNKKYKNV